MTKKDLIDHVVGNADFAITKAQAAALLDDAFEAVAASIVDDGRFAYPSFGTFTTHERAARNGRNPQTGKKIKIAASTAVRFKPAPGLKDRL